MREGKTLVGADLTPVSAYRIDRGEPTVRVHQYDEASVYPERWAICGASDDDERARDRSKVTCWQCLSITSLPDDGRGTDAAHEGNEVVR